MSQEKLHRLSERLQLNKFKLQTLLEITKGINDNLPISQLVAIYRGIVEGELGSEQAHPLRPIRRKLGCTAAIRGGEGGHQ